MSVTPYPAYQNHKSLWGEESLESVDRSRTRKRVAKAAVTVGNLASTGAQLGTHTGTIALATGAAAASATGIGLVVAGGVLTIGASVCAARSAYKTVQHRNVLEQLHRGSGRTVCQKIPSYGNAMPGVHEMLPRNHREHNVVADQVLSYLIMQKTSKYHRKLVSSVPGLGLVESVRAVGKKAYKALAGTLGEERSNAARWLAVHLITHDCALAQGIVAELYSVEEMLLMQTFDSDKLVPLLADKMRST